MYCQEVESEQTLKLFTAVEQNVLVELVEEEIDELLSQSSDVTAESAITLFPFAADQPLVFLEVVVIAPEEPEDEFFDSYESFEDCDSEVYYDPQQAPPSPKGNAGRV